MTVDPGQDHVSQHERDMIAYDRAQLAAFIEWFSYLEEATRAACLKLCTLDTLDMQRIKALGKLQSQLADAAREYGREPWFRVAREDPPAKL